MRSPALCLLFLSAISVQICYSTLSRERSQIFQEGVLSVSKQIQEESSFIELKSVNDHHNKVPSSLIEKAQTQSQSKIKQGPAGLFVNLANTAVTTNKQMQDYVQTRVTSLTSTTNAKTRALYLFLFATITVIVCCVLLQYILNNAKESRKYLTNLEKRNLRRMQAEEPISQQQQKSGLVETSNTLEAQIHQGHPA